MILLLIPAAIVGIMIYRHQWRGVRIFSLGIGVVLLIAGGFTFTILASLSAGLTLAAVGFIVLGFWIKKHREARA